jgi:hypothetical protein
MVHSSQSDVFRTVVAYNLGVELEELERKYWARQTGLLSALRLDSMSLEITPAFSIGLHPR